MKFFLIVTAWSVLVALGIGLVISASLSRPADVDVTAACAEQGHVPVVKKGVLVRCDDAQ